MNVTELNVVSVNGLVLWDNKRFPEPKLTQIYVGIWRH